MNIKTLKFIIVLFLLVAAASVVNYCWRVYADAAGKGTSTMLQLCHTVYTLSPMLAALVAEKWQVRRLIREYRITLKGVNVKKFTLHILAAAMLFPALVVLFTYVFGNLCGVSSAGEVLPLTGQFRILNFDLPEGPLLRFGIISLLALFYALLLLVYTFGEEVGWRGFLEKNLTCSGAKKTLFISLAWWLWSVPTIFVGSKDNLLDFGYAVGARMLFCVACSFYFVRVLRQSRTLFAPALAHGLILFYPLLFLTGGGSANYLFLAGNQGVFSTTSIILICVLFYRFDFTADRLKH
jgi:hypothetical protein